MREVLGAGSGRVEPKMAGVLVVGWVEAVSGAEASRAAGGGDAGGGGSGGSGPMRIIGMMSGTSLDGIDLVDVLFENETTFEILSCKTIEYDAKWRTRLENASNLSARDLCYLDHLLGKKIGEEIKQFMQEAPLREKNFDLIAIHGHTVFHEPQHGFTLQIGSGADVAAICNCKVVSKFRDLDVALGGQGAPLVPIGDRLLFGGYDNCLNLGGIANVSFAAEGEADEERHAFDICVCNMAINYLAQKLGLELDRDGKIGRNSNLNPQVFEELNSWRYLRLPYPKSLGKEDFLDFHQPLIEKYLSSGCSVGELLRSYYEHIAFAIASCVKKNSTLFVSGGGAKNKFLVERIASLCYTNKVIVADPIIIDYKEALIFALLGYLRMRGKANALRSVTGARESSCGGCIWL